MARASAAGDLQRHEDGVRDANPGHAAKILPAVEGITETALAAYYRSIAGWILPHIAGRPLDLVRCPAGAAPADPLAGMTQVAIGNAAGAATFGVVDDPAGLLGLAELGAVELHAWGARLDDIDHPDRMVFELAGAAALRRQSLVAAAVLLRDDLAALGFQSFVMAPGGDALHVIVPIARRHEWSEVKAFAEAFAAATVDEAPALLTLPTEGPAEAGKVVIDVRRNERGAMSLVPYSPRARPGAPVATPLAWSELRDEGRPEFSIATIPQRLARLTADPWADIDQIEQVITRHARKALRI